LKKWCKFGGENEKAAAKTKDLGNELDLAIGTKESKIQILN